MLMIESIVGSREGTIIEQSGRERDDLLHLAKNPSNDMRADLGLVASHNPLDLVQEPNLPVPSLYTSEYA
jgi:hypothetical protein